MVGGIQARVICRHGLLLGVAGQDMQLQAAALAVVVLARVICRHGLLLGVVGQDMQLQAAALAVVVVALDQRIELLLHQKRRRAQRAPCLDKSASCSRLQHRNCSTQLRGTGPSKPDPHCRLNAGGWLRHGKRSGP